MKVAKPTKQCPICSKKFVAFRTTQLFCSPKCRRVQSGRVASKKTKSPFKYKNNVIFDKSADIGGY